MLAIALPLLIPLVMFFVWRAWLADKGQDWEPKGQWESRMTATHEYLESQRPLTARQRWATWLLAAVGASIIIAALLHAILVR